jgi:hypothetical protein
MARAWLDRVSFPVFTAALLVFVPMALVFIGGSRWLLRDGVRVWNSELEFTGFVLVIVVVSTYLAAAFLALLRVNLRGLQFLQQQLLPEVLPPARYEPADHWWYLLPLFVTLCVQANINWVGMVWLPGAPGFWESVLIIAGQLVVWSWVGLVLLFSLSDGYRFHRLGRQVAINLYDLDQLNPLGRASLNGFLLIMGALALTALQSVDADFSWRRYQNPTLIGLPAAIAMALLPCWSVHRRIRREKRELLEKIAQQIRQCSQGLAGPDLDRLNALLIRRDQVQGFRTWPMDLSIVSRFLLYVFIPPLAWLGAAIVEIMLDAAIVN